MLFRSAQIIDETTIALNNGQNVRLLGVKIEKRSEAIDYLNRRVLGKNVFIKNETPISPALVAAYVYLKNKIFVNAYLIKSGLGSPDLTVSHKFQKKFVKLQAQ